MKRGWFSLLDRCLYGELVTISVSSGQPSKMWENMKFESLLVFLAVMTVN